MKKLTIRKNKRRPRWSFEFLPTLIRKNKDYKITKYIGFTDSAIYQFNDDDQHDVNKLFGFSFGWHHNNSVRFGWRPNEDLTKIEIVGYEYINKLRVSTIPIHEVELNWVYRYELKYNSEFNMIEYKISDGDSQFSTMHPITLKKEYNWGYKLGLYFGGNKKAPHNMDFYIQN